MIFSIVVEKDRGVYSKLVILKNNNQINSGYELFEKWKQDISMKDRIRGKHTYLYFKISKDSNIIEIISFDYILDFKDHIKVFFKSDKTKLSFFRFYD